MTRVSRMKLVSEQTLCDWRPYLLTVVLEGDYRVIKDETHVSYSPRVG